MKRERPPQPGTHAGRGSEPWCEARTPRADRGPAARVLHLARRLPLGILAQERVLHCILPLSVPKIRPPLHTLADVADPLRVPDRPFVEAEHGELEPVKAELVKEVA